MAKKPSAAKAVRAEPVVAAPPAAMVVVAEPIDHPAESIIQTEQPTPATSDAVQEVTVASPYRWVKMTTCLSGPEISLNRGDKHSFDSDEAQRLIDAGFAEDCDAPEA